MLYTLHIKIGFYRYIFPEHVNQAYFLKSNEIMISILFIVLFPVHGDESSINLHNNCFIILIEIPFTVEYKYL